ncbi:MAG: condensation domain-containing protein, partial [Chloroflexota bacterium]
MKKLENVADIYPLAPTQAGMLYQTLSEPDGAVYFEQAGYLLTGPLQVELLKEAWRQVILRHAPLRTAYVWDGLDDPLQVVRKAVDLPFEQLDWRDRPEATWTEAREAFTRDERSRPFDLTQAPVMRLTLIQLADERFELIWSYHHIILDGWSASIIINEVLDLYEGAVAGREVELNKAPQFKRFVAWIKKQDRAAAKSFWQNHLADFDEPSILPLATAERKAQAQNEKFLYATAEITLSEQETAGLNQFARRERLTLNTLIQGAWALLLSRYTRSNDVVFGATVSGRPSGLKGVGEIAGMFLNMVPVRARLGRDKALLPWLRGLQNKQLEMQRYDYVSAAEVQAWSDVPAGQSLVDSLLVFENYPTPEADRARTIGIGYFQIFGQTDYPLSIFVDPGQQLRLQAVYNGNIYCADEMEKLLGHLTNLLFEMVSPQADTLANISLLSRAEREQVVNLWNNTETPYPAEETLISLFKKVVAEQPNQVALIENENGNERTTTYAELDQRSSRLAHHLQTQGVGPNVLVGIAAERDADMLAALLAVVKAGGAYVPLDPSYPAERLRYIIDDAQISLLLTQSQVVSGFPAVEVPTILIDQFDGSPYSS